MRSRAKGASDLSKSEERRKDWSKSKAYKQLARSLLESLDRRGLTERVYTDKLEEYMDFWVRRQELKEDIAIRGLTVMDDRGRISENRSISLEIQVSRQMLTIFTALGFKADEKNLNLGGVDDDL